MSVLQVSAIAGGVGAQTATLNGVTAGSRLVAFVSDGSTSAPTTPAVADAQGGYSQITGSIGIDGTNFVWVAAYELLNANAGTHAAQFSVAVGSDDINIILVELSSPTTGASAANAALQAAPGTAANACDSGSVASTGDDTLLCLCTDSGANAAGSIPVISAGYTNLGSGQPTSMGSWRLSSKAIAAATHATASCQSATDGGEPHITVGVAVPNAPTGLAGNAADVETATGALTTRPQGIPVAADYSSFPKEPIHSRALGIQ